MIFIPIQECQLDGRDGYQFGPEGKCYTHDGTDEGREAAKTKAEEQGRAIESSKHSDSAPSYEYLKAVYDRVMAHPSIWAQIKDKIRVAARGSAGGQLKAKYASEIIKLENSAGGIVETEEHIDVPTVFMKEGVWTGADGTPTLKKYENMKPSANWFMGTPITPHHLKTDTARPTDRRIGQIVKSEARDDMRDIAGVSRFFKSQLTSDELEKIRNLQFPGGSAGYFTPRLSETGEFGGKRYQAVELGPYSVGEYAVLFDGTRAACEGVDGCGPYQNSAAVESDDVPDLEGGETKPCPLKLKNQGIDDMDSEEFKKLLNEAVSPVTEAVKGITTRIDALEKQLNEAPKLADQPEFKALEDSVKQLNSAMPDLKQFKDDQEAAKDLKARTAFSKLLNAAALEDGKVPDKIWNEAKADPIGFLDEHSEMRLGSVKQTEFTGKILNSDGSEFDLAREQAKLYGY